MGTALVIFLLLALCGFIAYIGDLLGRRLGKKRLSIFGLRPKHTAILLTIVTGVLIASVTFSAALIAVPGFRRTVVEGERLTTANKGLRKQRNDLQRQGAALSAEITGLSQKNAELAQTNSGLARQNATLTGESARLTTINTQLAGKNTRLGDDNARLVKESAGLQQLNKKLRSTNTNLQGVNGRLDLANRRLEASNTQLQDEMRRIRLAQRKIREEVTALRKETDDLKDGEYVFRRNQQIAFLPLPPNPPENQLQTAVKNLLYEARHPMGQTEARPLVLDPPTGYTGSTSKEEAMQEWIVRKAAAERNQRVVVRLVATENAVKGRPIRARLDYYANKLVFTRGEEIAVKRVDGIGSTGSIMEELAFLLQSGVQGKAKAMGMNAEKGELGEMTLDQILAVSEQVRLVEGPARVVAKARQDTYQSGPLNVDLEVSPIGSSEATRR